MDREKILNLVYGSSMWKDIKISFLDDAKSVNSKNDIMKFSNKYMMYMLFGSSIHTVKNRSASLRSLLEENDLGHLSDCFTISSNIYNGIKEEYKNKIIEENEVSNKFNHLKFTKDTIKKLIDNIDNNVSLSNSNMSKLEDELFYQKLFVLALSTGRRQIELLKTLTIRKKKDLALYEGLTKKRGESDVSCIAPILIDMKIAKQYLNDINDYLDRYNVKGLTNNQINSKMNGRIANAIKRYVGEYKFHFFRSCYAHSCYELLKTKGDKAMYFSKILGHNEAMLPAHAYTSK